MSRIFPLLGRTVLPPNRHLTASMKFISYTGVFLALASAVPGFALPRGELGEFSMPHGRQSFLVAPEGTQNADCEPLNPSATPDTLVGQLWRNNCDIVNRFLRNNFSVTAATQSDGPIVDAFRYYYIQDYYYLVQTVIQRASVLESYLPSPESVVLTNVNNSANSMLRDVDYTVQFRKSLVQDLEIDDSVIENGSFHAAGLGYVKWLQSNTNLGWFAFQVSRIACVYGWGELANSLYNSQNTKTDSLFYQNWIEPNLGWDYGIRMIDRLQAQVDLYNNTETFKAYNELFRQGMAFEILFFESALGRQPADVLA